MIATLQGRSGLNGILSSSGFYLPLYDSGSGAVNTTLARGVGAPTFTRATEAACRLSTGLWKLDVASGVARSHYWEFTPGTMTYGGYLPEPAATQLALLPRDMTNAAWVKVNVTAVKNATGIDGVTNSACTLSATVDDATILQTVVAAASTRTYSAFIRRKTGSGQINIRQGVEETDITSLINSTTYTQVQLSASVLNAAFGIYFFNSGDEIEVDCNQFEAGAVATTPIPAAGTRNADVLTYTYTGNANTAQGSVYAEMATTWATNPTGACKVIGLDGSDGTPMDMQSMAVTECRVQDNTNSASKAGLSSVATGVRKRSSSWGAAGIFVTGDGLAVASSSFDGTMGTDAVGIGCGGLGGGGQLSGTIKNVRIWTSQLANQQLQAITS